LAAGPAAAFHSLAKVKRARKIMANQILRKDAAAETERESPERQKTAAKLSLALMFRFFLAVPFKSIVVV
jgi:hypothetical protein